jgi:RHS repeat-associated protein
MVGLLIPMLVPGTAPLASARPSQPPTRTEPVAFQAPAPSPAAAAPNQTVPRVRPASASLSELLSRHPSQADLSRARVFEEPLVPAWTPSDDENAALGAALLRYHGATAPEQLDALEAFLEEHPGSPWGVALRTNLGLVAVRTGYFSKALEYYEAAWREGQAQSDAGTRLLAERAVSEWAFLLMGLGHQERLAQLLDDLAGRAFSGSSAERVRAARQGLSLMQAHPELAFRCGPVALARLLGALGHEDHDDRVAHAPASARGTSLAQLRELAQRAGVSLHMARRSLRDAALPVPAVVHLKTGHFAALIERSGDRYLVADPVFDEERWISRAALDAESSGYVLSPELPVGFVAATEDEAGDVWGRSCPSRPDPTQQGDCEDQSGGGGGGGGGCPSGNCDGMAGYSFLTLLSALRIRDTPLRYTPPKGPAVSFTLTYNQKEVFQPAVFTYANVGPKWTFGALAYVEDDPTTTAAQTVKVYRPGGGMEVVSSLVGSTPGAPDFRTRAVLVRVTSSPVRYERRASDGSVEVFAQPDGTAAFPRKVFLSEVLDPQGNKLSYIYADNLQLQAIVDALGQVTTLAYADASALRVTSITDPFGRSATLTYDSLGRLASITDVLGLTSSFTYGANDFITSMTTPYGTTRFTTGDNSRRSWIEAQDPLGARERLEYVIPHDATIGPRFLPADQIPAGFSAYNGNFDAAVTLYWDKRAMMLAPGDISKAEIKHWLENPVNHRPRGLVRAHKKALEGRVWYAYEGQTTSHGNDGRLVRTGRLLDDPDGAGPLPAPSQIWQYARNLAGQLCSVIDPLGRETRYTYGTNNVPDAACASGGSIDLLKVEQKNGTGWDVVQQTTYNAQHLPLTSTDGANQTTTYTYNAAGQLASVTTPPRAGITEQRTTTYTYATNTSYLTSMVAPGGVTSTYGYDAYGRVRTLTNNDNDTTTYDYDAFDRMTRATYPDGSFEEHVYERLDLARRRDRLGRWSEAFHDALRRVVSTRDALGREVHQEWCACGSLNRLTDANGHATTWEYDLQGRPTKTLRANGSFERLSYEGSTSRLKEVLDAKGQIKRFTYLLDDRLQSQQYVNALQPTPNVSFDYTDPATSLPDAHGRVRSILDGSGTTTYTYRPFGTLGAGQTQTVDNPFANDSLTYTYDELSRVVARDFAGTVSTWSFDQQGRVQTQGETFGTFTYAYIGNTPRVGTLTYPNNQRSIYSYLGAADDRRLQSITHVQPGGASLNLFEYAYDDMGNITSWTKQPDTARPQVYVLEYDRADQLTAATATQGPGPTVKRYRYAYDAAGNRSADQVDDAVTQATHDNMNRLLSQQPGGVLALRGVVNEAARVTVAGAPATVTATNEFSGAASVPGGVSNVVVTAQDYANNTRTNTYQITASGDTRSFTYDLNGNMSSRTEGGVTTIYTWDAEDRLIAATQGATTLATFAYDGLGRRWQKTGAGVTRTYIYAGDDIVEERVAGGLTLRFVHGLGVDQHLAQYVVGGSLAYLLADHLGSIVRQTDAAGNITFTRDYDPWGNLLTGATVGRYAYTGREWDPETGLYYYRARYYDARLGRFLSEDPIGFGGGINLYPYVGSNPVNWIDPSGHVVVKRGPTTMHMKPSNTVVPHCEGRLGCTDTKGGISHRCYQEDGCWRTEFTVEMSIDIWVSDDLGWKTSIVAAHERGHAAISDTWFNQVVADARTMESYRFCSQADCERQSNTFERAWILKLKLRQFFYDVLD